MNELLSTLSVWLIDVVVLGTALLGGACLTLAFLRRPEPRMAIARGTLLGLAMLCVLTALPTWPRRTLAEFISSTVAEEEGDESLATWVQGEAAFPAPLLVDSPQATIEQLPFISPKSPSSPIATVGSIVPLIWMGAAAAALAYIFLGAFRAYCLLRSAAKAPAWSQRELESLVVAKNHLPRLKTSERIATAAALVAWRPHILLATKIVCEENRTAVRAALAHEWAHIRHGDLWLLALERLLLPMFCLHPLFWLLRRQIRIDQELLADAAAAGDAPVEYAQALLAWAKTESNQAGPSFGIAALSLWEHPSSISRRVEMLLHAPATVSARGFRIWKWLAPLFLLAAVLGMSLFTLRPAAIAQDDAAADAEAAPRPAKIKNEKKEKPWKTEVNRQQLAPLALDFTPDSAPSPQIILELLIGQVEFSAFDKAESSLGDLVQEAAEDHCRLEGNLIVAELSAEQYAKLTANLKEVSALKILSRPKVITQHGQEAKVQVGGQVPVAVLEASFNGDSRRRLEYRNVGEMITVLPFISGKDSSRLTLEIVAEHAELDKKAELRTGDDTPRFITHKFHLESELMVGKTLIVTEREPKKGSGRGHSILLAIEAQKVVLPVPIRAPSTQVRKVPDGGSVLLSGPIRAPSTATQADIAPSGSSDDLKRLQNENAVLRKQIQEMQGRLIDFEVQIRLLRDAAAPGGGVWDDEFLRRVYLDLTEKFPSRHEIDAFLSDKDPQKRNKLIDKLLSQKVFKDPSEAEEWKRAHPKSTPFKPSADEPQPKNAPAEEPIVQLIHLSTISAGDAAKLLEKLFAQEKKRPEFAADERTNSLVFRGTRVELELLMALVAELDRGPDPKASSDKQEPQGKSDPVRDLRIMDLRKADAMLQAAQAQYQRMQVLRKEGAVSEADFYKALYQLRHAEVILEAIKGGTPSQKLFELELQESEAAVTATRLQLAELGRDDPSRTLVEQNLQLCRQDLEMARTRLEEFGTRQKQGK